MMYDKILVAVEHSERNKSVFDTAVSLAKATGAKLMLLHVISEDEAGYPMLPTYAYYYPVLDERDYETHEKKVAEYQQWGIDFLQNLTQQAIAAGVKAEHTQLTGNPGRTICEIADNWSADLILVGSRGLQGLKEMFLGSVSNYVTHNAPCSVLIVRSAIAQSKNSNSPSEAKSATTIDN